LRRFRAQCTPTKNHMWLLNSPQRFVVCLFACLFEVLDVGAPTSRHPVCKARDADLLSTSIHALQKHMTRH
jgi:hypothetical protein